MTLDPGHFHAALVQKEMHTGVASRVEVYAPLGPDVLAHLARIAGFNARADRPTAWEVEVHTGPGYEDRLFREKPANVLVLSGRNRGKMQRIHRAVEAGLHVLADKPWLIDAADLPLLASTLELASERGVLVYDMMTERYEITSLLQREFIQTPAVFGQLLSGTLEEPAVYMESVHFLLKLVAGRPNLRPEWFFDVEQQGEGLSDVGTHLVDLVPWLLFPGRALDWQRDVELQQARRWPTLLSREDYQRVTGASDFAFLGSAVQDGKLAYYCNTEVHYRLCGVQVHLDVRWDYASSEGGGDTHHAVVGGSRCRVEVRQDRVAGAQPEVYLVANDPGDRAALLRDAQRKIADLQTRWPGVGVEEREGELRVTIPDGYRVGHEAHFGEVTRQFLEYLRRPGTLPSQEWPNLLAKYHVTTAGVALARRGS
jgi:predicted dehydrogenase